MSYVLKRASFRPEQIYLDITADLFHFRLTMLGGKKLNILNIYIPPGPNKSNTLWHIYQLPPQYHKENILIQGALNHHHYIWQPSWSRIPSKEAETFVTWTDTNNVNIFSLIDKATHNMKNTLD